MDLTETLVLKRCEVAQLLSIEDCIKAVEQAFELYGEGKAMTPKVLGIHAGEGGFHIKAGILGLSRNYFVSKLNANFPNNTKQHGLPTIQGVVIVCDAHNGRLLALMDSIEITILRTGAATAVAANYLALSNVNTVTVCGCGNQGNISLKALMKVRTPKKVFAFDINENQVQVFCNSFEDQIEVLPVSSVNLSKAIKQSEICIACTPSRQPFIDKRDVKPGTFIAAVGADSEDKQELCSELLATAKIVTDLTNQAAAIGELHHAIKQGIISAGNVYAELGEIVAKKKVGRESNDEIIVFDSTGMALQDVAAAAIVYEKAMANKTGMKIDFAERGRNIVAQ